MNRDGGAYRVSDEKLGALDGCLVDGDAEQELVRRKVRRRALGLSIAVQGLVLAAIVLVPLFGKPARIALANFTPIPPYRARPAVRSAEPRTPLRPRGNTCRFCAPLSIPQHIATSDPVPSDDGNDQPIVDGIAVDGAIPPMLNSDVSAPAPPRPVVLTPHVVKLTHIDPAMLTRRVEPIYPTLAKQIGRSGRVELHAVIGEDGTIRSLEAVAGDPIFFRSALDAVQLWKYTPTLLNGQRVEVDTYITVIYNMQR
jgi:periplasmic protein TonB